MKRATKFVVTATLATAILSVSAVFASNETPAAPSPTQSPVIITPLTVDNEIVNSPISGSSFTKSFNIQPDFGWVKVWVQNTSSEILTVRVTQSTISGTEKMTFTVAPGETKTGYGKQAWATGTHWVSISTKNGGNMSGLLSVKLANTKGEF
jgi:hypothetical protein